MAYATVDGRKHLVRVTRDLAENWAVEVYPEPPPGKVKVSEPYKHWPVPLIMKLKADTAEDALVCVLEQMKKAGSISDYHVDENEKPKPPPAKPAPVAAVAAVAPAAAAAKPAAPAEKKAAAAELAPVKAPAA